MGHTSERLTHANCFAAGSGSGQRFRRRNEPRRARRKGGTEGKLAEKTINSSEERASRGESQGEFPYRRLLRALRVLGGSKDSTFQLVQANSRMSQPISGDRVRSSEALSRDMPWAHPVAFLWGNPHLPLNQLPRDLRNGHLGRLHNRHITTHRHRRGSLRILRRSALPPKRSDCGPFATSDVDFSPQPHCRSVNSR